MKGDIVSIQNAEELPEKLRAETDGRIRPRLIFEDFDYPAIGVL
ncbi:hypothetical protein P0O24_04000 [Methanotrichaceae archaeon M04Ac]|uniref:Uncharacterized protein n=1 Tax=Candidatus Methanocrinis alkalitolerans TaxID=3033395 RepID=A0ABT5XDI0_9EURY|nr:hypothetical protein [Candidatus Methanocrinis alkalitolerans]MDF0592742.1 hypothetical protein [Candidatus Methanocrinis alkalitolerans]